LTCGVVALVGVAGLWPILDGPARSGILAAAAIALPLQIAAFALLSWGQRQQSRFLAAWLGGTLARLLAVCGATVWVVISGRPAAPTLLSLVAFLFAMLLLESFFLPRSGTALA
jgi:hypothetical protein